MSIQAGRLYIRQTKERSEEIRMSGKSQTHKGKKLWTDAMEILSSIGMGICTANR